MKTQIAILGSTGSIGKSLLKIISRNKNSFKISLLTANKNYKLLLNQAIKFNVRNVIITDSDSYNISKNIFKQYRIRTYNNFKYFKKIFSKKNDYVMSSIVGLDGLIPTFEIIKFTNRIAIANKESIICAWNILAKELKKYKTQFIPVDSEHFSVWYALKGTCLNNVDKLYLTASGGPLLKTSFKELDKIKIKKIINHPNWKMGKKISVDSSTMINKIFEVIEAKKIFNLSYKDLEIIIHPKSYIHAFIKFKDGMIKIIAHETTMEIPIYNTLKYHNINKLKSKKIDLKKLNNLNFSKISSKKFPLIKIINELPNSETLFETVLVTINDELVKLLLNKKITYLDLIKKLLKLITSKEFVEYKFIEPKKINDILDLNKKIKSVIQNHDIIYKKF
ncbi:1-deoxy-D-xylulose-5-phosphate reductoisomerase [Candidatus Pelagibacter sp. HIMB1593]|uniref:1-deoxy-D-xylulose-5-phosphate reductoisomerase n=1 Tax=Candidatus Pelagibacter sp. HIMB1593 TaxID=3413355 RepID=UPI003F875C29